MSNSFWHHGLSLSMGHAGQEYWSRLLLPPPGNLSDPGIEFTSPALVEKEMATHSSALAWRIPGTEGPGGLPSMGSHRVGHDWSDLAAAAAAPALAGGFFIAKPPPASKSIAHFNSPLKITNCVLECLLPKQAKPHLCHSNLPSWMKHIHAFVSLLSLLMPPTRVAFPSRVALFDPPFFLLLSLPDTVWGAFP